MASRVINALGLRAGSDKTTVRTPLGEFRVEKAKEVGPACQFIRSDSGASRLGSRPRSAERRSAQVLQHLSYELIREYVVNWYLEHLSGICAPGQRPKKLPKPSATRTFPMMTLPSSGERGDQIRVVPWPRRHGH